VKRFTDTELWEKPWFRKLTAPQKLLFKYLCDKCDKAGVIDPDFELISFTIGSPVSVTDMEKFNGNVVRFGKKWRIPGFVPFQYGPLSLKCKPHMPVIELLKRYGIPFDSLSDTLSKPINRAEEEDKEEDQEEEKEKRWSIAQKWHKQAISAGADYSEEELKMAFQSLSVNGFMWGNRPIADLPGALETRINENRKKYQHSKPAPEPIDHTKPMTKEMEMRMVRAAMQ